MLPQMRAPGLALFCLLLAGCVQTPQDGASARVSYYRSRAAGPATYPAYARLGTALLDRYRETGEEQFYFEAIRSFEQSLKFQRNAEALMGMGNALSERHQFKKAVPYLREAVDAMPEMPEAQSALFDTYLALGDRRAAAEVLAGLRRSGCPDFICATRGASLAEYDGDYKAAVEEMERAVRAAHDAAMPGTIRAWSEVRLGSLHMMSGNADAAMQCYQRAMASEPGYFFAREHIGEWHAARGEWAKAENVYRLLLKDHPEPGYRVALAEALEYQKRFRDAERLELQAMEELRSAVKRGAVDHYRELAVLLLSMGEAPEEALELARRDWQLREDIFAADIMAWALSTNERHEEAIKMSTAALAVNTNHPALLVHGAVIRMRGGLRAEGESLLAAAKAKPLAFTCAERRAMAQVEQLAGAAPRPQRDSLREQSRSSK